MGARTANLDLSVCITLLLRWLADWVGWGVVGDDDWVLSLITLHQSITKFHIRLTRICAPTENPVGKCKHQWYICVEVDVWTSRLGWAFWMLLVLCPPRWQTHLYYYCYYCSCQNVLSCLCFYMFTVHMYPCTLMYRVLALVTITSYQCYVIYHLCTSTCCHHHNYFI